MTTAIITKEPALVVADVIEQELELSSDQVVLENQKWRMPSDERLYVVVSYVSGKAIGNVARQEPTDGGFQEVQGLTMRELIQIDLFSFSDQARRRKNEVLMALHSDLCERMQELYNMQIARIPGEFINTSELEAVKMLNRFTITVPVTALYTKAKEIPYYDQFVPVTVNVQDAGATTKQFQFDPTAEPEV